MSRLSRRRSSSGTVSGTCTPLGDRHAVGHGAQHEAQRNVSASQMEASSSEEASLLAALHLAEVSE
nr:hypothetical protein DA06_02685 [Georgenia sp. SUBG003]